MNRFSSSFFNEIHWTLDQNGSTPADFGDGPAEYRTLSEKAAWIDFSHYGCVVLSGPERVTFLGGLITNQLRHVSESRSVYSAMLTPQGRFLRDFTMVDYQDQLLLITEPGQISQWLPQISMYLLRSKVQIMDQSTVLGLLGVAGPNAWQAVQQLFPDFQIDTTELGATGIPEQGMRLWRDPRHPDFGWRLLVPAEQLPAMRDRLCAIVPPAGLNAWETYRIGKALPRGGNELIAGETLPLEMGLLELNGVDFSKGCYVGQETTARTHHRGTIKKRLFQITFKAGEPISPGMPIVLPAGKEAGVVTSSAAWVGVGLAHLRLSDVDGNAPLAVQDVVVLAQRPTWAAW